MLSSQDKAACESFSSYLLASPEVDAQVKVYLQMLYQSIDATDYDTLVAGRNAAHALATIAHDFQLGIFQAFFYDYYALVCCQLVRFFPECGGVA